MARIFSSDSSQTDTKIFHVDQKLKEQSPLGEISSETISSADLSGAMCSAKKIVYSGASSEQKINTFGSDSKDPTKPHVNRTEEPNFAKN